MPSRCINPPPAVLQGAQQGRTKIVDRQVKGKIRPDPNPRPTPTYYRCDHTVTYTFDSTSARRDKDGDPIATFERLLFDDNAEPIGGWDAWQQVTVKLNERKDRVAPTHHAVRINPQIEVVIEIDCDKDFDVNL